MSKNLLSNYAGGHTGKDILNTMKEFGIAT